MSSPASIVGSLAPVQTASLVATVVVLVNSFGANWWCCKRERVRRASLDRFSRAIQEELAESGYRALFASPVVLCLIVVILLREGGEVLPV